MAYLSCLLGLVLGGLVVPVLEVLVYSSLLRTSVLLEHRSHATSCLGRFPMHGLVELGIASVILLFKRNWRHVESLESIIRLKGKSGKGILRVNW
jgi:hypothetical protein